MLTADRLAVRIVASDVAALWRMVLAKPTTVTAPWRVAAAREGRRMDEVAPAITRDVVRQFAAAAIGLNIALSLIDVWRIAYLAPDLGPVAAAALAAAIAVPLHIRHVVFALRGLRPPAGLGTLLALALVNAVAVPFVGNAWLFQFASLAVSILIVVPGRRGMILAGAVVLSPLFIVGTQWYAVG